MNKRKIIIIGAGIAGLSAGCYGQMNGYETEIFEMHNIPGGLCTSWTRKGYTFDGCIHFLMGTNQNSWLNHFWKTVGAIQGNENEIINPEVYMQIDGELGKKLILYSDINKLEKHMLGLSFEDSSLILELTDAIRNFSLTNTPADSSKVSRLRKISMQEFSREFKDPFLRESLAVFKDMQFFLSTMSAYNNSDAGWPTGGSLEFAKRLGKRYLDLGGRISYKAKVEEIIVKDDHAIGIKLSEGSVFTGDIVISAANGYSTIFSMLQGKYTNDEIISLYTEGKTYPTSVQISLGINCDLSKEAYNLYFKTHTPIEVLGEDKTHLFIKNYSFDKTMCPSGKSIVTTTITSNYEYWERLGRGSAAYNAEKVKIADVFVKALEEKFPQIKGKVEVIDVATPLTYARYTDAWKGAYMGWLSTPERPISNVPSTLPRLEDFYMTGQWTYSRGGLPTALMTARGSLIKICSEDGKKFIDTLDS